jgi:predicted homoserine dehydrogenase-like protein
MSNLREGLIKREKDNNPIRSAIIGTGQMGTGIVDVMNTMDGMKPVLVADVKIEKAKAAFHAAGIDESMYVECDDPIKADEVVEQGKYVVTKDGVISCFMRTIDSVLEATGIPEVGAYIALKTILNKKHIVMMNVESDVVIGPLLKKFADSAGVVYTGVCGDEPAATTELVEFCENLGLEVVCAGKGKNTPLHIDANPDNLFEYFPKAKELVAGNPRMFVEFVDGSKTAIEMTALSNATGLTPDVRGMHGPQSDVDGLNKIYRLKEDGGILGKVGTVDYAVGVAPGVFVVARAKKRNYANTSFIDDYITFYRPYHIPSLEAALSVAKAVILHEASIAPLDGPVSETICLAKKDLHIGDTLDGIGGFTVYGSIEIAQKAKEDNLLPLGLSVNASVKREVAKGSYLTYDDVTLDENSTIVVLRKLQDKMFA